MPGLVLHCLGPPSLEYDGQPVHVARRKALALFIYLAVNQRPHSRDVLAALFWPDLGERQARTMLRHALAALHQAIGAHWLVLTEDRVAVAARPDLAVDIWQFRALLASVAAHHHPPYALCDECVAALSAAVAIAQAGFLAGFSLPDAAEFELWQLAESERVQRELATALEQLAHVHALAGRREFTQAIEYAHRWLALDPLHEPAHRALMRFYVWSGDRAAAQQQYQECVRILATELDAAPDAETTDLYEQIRTGRVVEPARLPSPLLAHNLPPQPTPFVGRTHELAQLATQLDNPMCRLLTVVGPGGVGKTRLAIEAARARIGSLAHGVWFIDLAPVASPDLVPEITLRVLDAPQRGTNSAQRELLSYLRDKTLLLVVDNCEHLLPAADLLVEMLHEAPGLKVLATSRTRLNRREEWLQPLAGLAAPPLPELAEPGGNAPATLPPALSPAELEAYDATRLFLQCVRQLRPDFQPTAQDALHITHICHRLEGMPLGIELAAAWIRTLPLAALVVEVDGSLGLLKSALDDAPPRQRSMSATFEHSWRLASAREQSILRQCSIFRGGFTRAAAEAVAGASLGDLQTLIDKSWVRLLPSGRYVLHELTRQFCAEKLAGEHCVAASETVDQVRQRHCAHYSAFLHAQMQRMNYHQDVIDNVMQEFGNLQAAWDWTLEQGAVQFALDMVVNLLFLAEMAGRYHFVAGVYETAAAQLAPLAAPDQSDAGRRQAAAVVFGWIEYCRGNLFNHLGLIEKARASVAANDLFLKTLAPGDAREELLSLNELLDGVVLYFEGKFHQARRIFRKRMAGLQSSDVDFSIYGHEVGATFWQANALGFLGLIAYLMGNYPEAKRKLAAAIALRQQTGEVRFRAHNHSLLARVLTVTGDYQAAEEQAHSALRLSQSCGDPIGIAGAHLALSRVEAANGRLTLSQMHCQQSLAMGRQSGNLHLLMDSLIQLGRIELALGQPGGAATCFEEAIEAFVALDTVHSNRVGAVLLGLGWAALAAGDHARAEHFFRETLTARGCAAWETLDAHAGLAQVLAATGRTEAAAELSAYVFQAHATAHATRIQVEHRAALTLPAG
jgi:predicted ATPase/DNA-binding SARP family transcriptional activator